MAVRKTIKYEADRDKEFPRWVASVIGTEKINQCIQCGLCSATCPMSLYMDYTPRRLIMMAKEGFKRDVLRSFTIWLCTSCYACTAECPKQIKVTEIMYALKRRAMREGLYPHRFPFPVLAREFYKMVYRRGRVTELRLATILFLKTKIMRLVAMWRTGLKLLRAGRFSIKLKGESIERRKELSAILDAAESSREVAS